MLPLQNGERIVARSRVDQNAVIAFPQIDHVRANAANRADFGAVRLALINRHHAGYPAFGQYFIHQVGVHQARLGARSRRIVDHDRQRAAVYRRFRRQTGKRSRVSGYLRLGRLRLLRCCFGGSDNLPGDRLLRSSAAGDQQQENRQDQ